MRTDDNIHQSFFQICHRLFLFRCCAEPAHQIHPHREVFHSLDECVVMLLGQNRGGHQIGHLFSLLHCLERSPDRNLCLAVSHIPADQTIHDLGALHVLFRCLYRKNLILRFLKGKHFLKFFLPDGIRSVDKPLFLLSRCIQIYQFLGDDLYSSPHPGLCTVPVLRA